MLFSPLSRFGADPFAEVRQLQANMNRLFDEFGGTEIARGYPPINLWLSENSVVVTAELPGFSADDIGLSIREDTLTIQGERKPADEGEVRWHRRERTHGRFARTVELPYRVDPDHVQARFLDGVLEVEMQRSEADLPRKVKISAK